MPEDETERVRAMKQFFEAFEATGAAKYQSEAERARVLMRVMEEFIDKFETKN